MLSCDGHVVGVADKLLEARIGFGVPVIHLSNLVGKIGDEEVPRALDRPRRRDRHRVERRRVVVLRSLPRRQHRRLRPRRRSRTRIGILFAGKNDTSDPIVDRSVRRIFGELVLGYRVLLFPYAFPTYFTLGAGILGTIDRGEETRLGASLGPAGCTGAACVATLSATTNAIRGGGIEPLGNAVLHIGGLELSYGFALDVIHPDYSTHRVLLGLSL